MISTLDPSALQFLAGMNNIQRRLQRTQNELTTGLRINTVSDDPNAIPNLIETKSDLSRAQQIDSNLGNVKAEVDGAEGVLQNAVTLIERAQTLGTQGQTGFASADTRQSVANELGAVLQQMVTVANTNVGGRYVFSGDSDQTQPYTIDLTLASPISAYQGTAATRQVESADGSTFAVSKTAQDIFDSADPTTNVFQSINNLRTALLNNDQTAVNSALSDVQNAGSYLNQQLAFYGTVQDRVNSSINFGANYETQLKTQLSGIQDADATQSITEFVQAQTQQQAALTARSKMPQQSLFNYLA